MSQPIRISVGGGQDRVRSYAVLVGRDLAGQVCSEVTGRRRVALIYPRSLSGHAQQIGAAVRDVAPEVLTLPIPDGEAAKSIHVAESCWQALGEGGFTRDDVILGIGGGSTTDLAGFVAATWLRGVSVVHVPTTLLGMVDAAVGGKTGINTPAGKNLVGSFHQPASVICDLDSLSSLPREEIASGLAEVVKCGFVADPVILQLVESSPSSAVDPSGPVLAELVERAVRVKAAVVSADFRETRPGGLGREVVNYGHTFGHAIEQVEGYRVRHGDAVAVGMVYVAELAALAGCLDPAVVRRHRELLTAVGLPTSYPGGHWDQLLAAMRVDKKTRGDRLRFVVLEAVGEPAVLESPDLDLMIAAYAKVQP